MGNQPKKGVIIVAFSQKFKEFIRDTTAGMSDNDVVALTGIPFGTWRRIRDGHIPEKENLLKLAKLPLPIEQIYAAAYGQDTDWKTIAIETMEALLRHCSLPPASRLKVMQTLRDELSTA